MIQFTPYASSSKGNLYTVDDGRTRLMIECGLPWKEIRRALEFRTSEIRGILISHAHKDHCRAASDAAKAGLDVYTSQATLDTLGLSGHRFHPVNHNEVFYIDSWAVLPFRSVHEGEEGDTLGFLLQNREGEKCLFLTDTCYCPFRFNGLSVIAIECNYAADILTENVSAGEVHPTLRRRIMRSHMSLETVKEMLLANDVSQVKEIWLLHLSNGNSDEEQFKREIQETTGKPVMVA
ncbi:MAG: MBL fold metallo-hydrolase [Thermoleophilia bacterium]